MRLLKRLLLVALLVALAYVGYHVYLEVVTHYVENHPAGQEHRPDVFGR